MDDSTFGEPPRDSSGMQRVKLYRLTPDGLWDEKGTGSVSVEYMEVCTLFLVSVCFTYLISILMLNLRLASFSTLFQSLNLCRM
jgi:hypothetical protein